MTLALGDLQIEGNVVGAERLAPTEAPAPSNISVVVPVRDNAPGIGRLLRWWRRDRGAARVAKELIIVDDGSKVPVAASAESVRVLRIEGRGPAAARNAGWRAAEGLWVAFTDSDCIPEEGWPGVYVHGWSGEIAVQGRVRALGANWICSFYESQAVLAPMAWTAEGRPRYLITANALVHRPTLDRLGGFRELFTLAAGEDVDLGLRLSREGLLRFCPEAAVAHDFDATLASFVRRFIRYGRGNRQLTELCGSETDDSMWAPRPFMPRSGRVVDVPLAALAFGAMLCGWAVEGAARAAVSRP